MNLKELVDSKVFSSKLEDISIEAKCVINTINPHSYCVAKKDKNFSDALLQSDILLPDGIGIVWVTRFLNGNRIKKIAGADIHLYLLKDLNKKNGRVFYLGASLDTLKLIKNRVNSEFPKVKVGYFSPPYKARFSKLDSIEMLKSIQDFEPDVLFVGMTAPKQEKWVHAHKKEIDVKTIVSIGAVFDFYSGRVKRPSQLWIKLGLEWFPRLMREPKRLWERTFISMPIFIFDMLKVKLNKGRS